MSEKKLSKQDKKLAEALKGLTAKERREAEAAMREKRRNKIYIAIGAVVAVLVAALLVWDNGVIQRNITAVTVGDRSYSPAVMDYYFNSSYNSIYSYASYYGLDTDTPLDEQEAYDGTTWYEYFMESATDSLVNVSSLAQEGEAAGYQLSEDGKESVKSTMQDLSDTAAEYGITESSLLSQEYGRYMTKGLYRKLVEEAAYASDYASYKRSSFEVTDDEIDEYYEENAASLDTYDYECYLINARASSTTDEDGNTVDPTEEETAAALAQATALAQELQEAMAANDTDKVETLVANNSLSAYSSISPSYLSSYVFGEWLTDTARQSGETTICNVTSTSTDDDGNETETITGYYVVKFNSRVRDDYYGLNIYNLQVNAEDISEEDAEEKTYDMDAALTTITGYQDSWLSAGGTADAFAELAKEHSDDSNSSSGGYTENAHKGSTDDVINDWLFGDETRSAGDYIIVADEDNHCYQLIYVDSVQDMYYWQSTVKSTLQSQKYSSWYSEISESYEAETTDYLSLMTAE